MKYLFHQREEACRSSALVNGLAYFEDEEEMREAE
jgi:hypothetical protein